MSVYSMTGFGRGEASDDKVKVTVELGTVNRKQFDCNVALPREYLQLEMPLQKLLKAHITRGYVKGSVTISPVAGANAEATLDVAALSAQVSAIRAAATALGLPGTISAADLLSFPDVCKPHPLELDPEALWQVVERATTAALENLTEMRKREGETLVQDLRARLDALHAIARQIQAIAPSVPGEYKQQLEKRLAELLPNGTPIDAQILAHEVALFADRCDISEEQTRLESHFLQAEKIFAEGGACGRTLDFLCQEFFREINTTGSKANNAEIAKLVIAFKAGLEAIREQVQNVE